MQREAKLAILGMVSLPIVSPTPALSLHAFPGSRVSLLMLILVFRDTYFSYKEPLNAHQLPIWCSAKDKNWRRSGQNQLPGKHDVSIPSLSLDLFVGNSGSKEFSIDLLTLDFKPPESGPEPYLGHSTQQV